MRHMNEVARCMAILAHAVAFGEIHPENSVF
jgi:hypothetical protein